MKKKIISMLFTLPLLIPHSLQAQTSYAKLYQRILKNPHQALAKDCLYLETYKGKAIQVSRYFLYDLNKDKIPELFLIGTKAYQGFCFYITARANKIGDVYYECFDRINKKQKAIITPGHFHGAGGSGTYEYHAIRLMGKPLNFQNYVYIDHFATGTNVTIYVNQKRRSATMKNYNQLYQKYVKGATKLSRFKSYSLKNKKGLSHISS